MGIVETNVPEGETGVNAEPVSVLIADDHRLYRLALRYLLQNNEPSVVVVDEAADGRTTIERALKVKPDIVLMDVAMPRLNGVGAARRIVEENPNIRIIALSAHVKHDYVVAMLRAGAKGYLDKNCEQDELRDAVRTVMKGETYLCPQATAVLAQDYVRSDDGAASVFVQLSQREREVLQLLAEGYTSKESAKQLSISEATIHTHRKHILDKLELRGTSELVRYAIRSGLVDL